MATDRRRLCLPSMEEGRVRLDADLGHRLRDVLRLDRGDGLEVFDGAGRRAEARIVELGKRGVELEIDAPTRVEEPGPRLTVAVPQPRGERADWLVEKLTELGVDSIVWLKTERTTRGERPGAEKAGRFLRLARSAAEQCGRCYVPGLAGPVELAALPGPATSAGETVLRLVADPGGDLGAAGVDREVRRILLVLGPEGGLTDTELARLEADGFRRLRLAPFVLRVETAAVAGAAQLLGR